MKFSKKHLLFYFFNKKTVADDHRKFVKIYRESSPSIPHQQNTCDLDGSKVMILMSVRKNAQPKSLKMQNCKNYWMKTQLNLFQIIFVLLFFF